MEIFDSVLKHLMTFGIWDFIDIAIVAYAIYKLIVFSRRSNTGQVVKGVLLILVIAQISGMLGLNMINFLLVNTMQLGLLALVILFQPELRKAFEKFGSKRFVQFSTEKEKENGEVTLLEFLNGLAPDQQRAALVHLSLKWAEAQAKKDNLED